MFMLRIGVQYAKVVEIGEQPFGSLRYKKLDSVEFTPKDESNKPLPF